MVRLRFTLLLSAMLACANPAAALEDDLLPGTTLALRQGKKGERLVVIVRAAIPAPLPGGTDDPRLRGARVDIGNPASHEWAHLNAPSAGWSVNDLGTLFRFRNASPKDRRDEPLQIIIRHGKRIKVVGRAIGITLDEPAQHSLTVVITSGTRRYCLVFGGKVRHDEPGWFLARAAPAPSSCPTPSETPTPTASTTTSTRPQPARSPTSTSTLAPSPASSTSTIPPTPTSTTSTSTTPTTITTSTTTALPPSTTSTTRSSDGGDPCDNLDIPSGHRPPAGLCRIWFLGVSAGHQPAPGSCDELAGNVPAGACLIRG